MWRAVKEGGRSEGADVPTGVPRPLRFRRLLVRSLIHSFPTTRTSSLCAQDAAAPCLALTAPNDPYYRACTA